MKTTSIEVNKKVQLSLDLSTGFNENLLARFSASRTIGFDFSDDVQSFDDLSEDHVFPVQPGSLDGADEELGAVRSRSGVGHAQNSWNVWKYFSFTFFCDEDGIEAKVLLK